MNFFARFIFIAFFTVSLSFVSCRKAEAARTELVFGTVCTVNAFDDGTTELYNSLFERLHSMDEKFSTSKSNSEIEKINAAAGKSAVEISDEVLFVLKIALSFAEITNGAFDPTVGPLVKLWGINTEYARVPEQWEIDNALKLVDWSRVKIEENKVFLPVEGMRLDLGGIVKGYAADVLAFMVKEAGVKCAVIDLGGNIYVAGKKKDRSLWRVGVKNPQNPEHSTAITLSLPENSVVTSGVYERFFIKNNIRYHHIINPKTGYPVDNGLTSVTIVSKSSTACDALSTSLFILGMEKGFALLKQLERQNFPTAGITVKEKTADSTDGMGMWLFGSGAVNDDGFENPVKLTAAGLPFVEKAEGMADCFNALYIDSENYMYSTEDLKKCYGMS